MIKEPTIDDLTCALGHGVVRCAAQDFSDDKPAHVAANSDGTCSDPNCPCQEFARKEVQRPQLWADAATVRAALFITIDEGWNRLPWHFDPEDETEAQSKHRYAFVSVVLANIARLQQPPHAYPRLEVLCPTHVRRRLTSYSGWCVDCAKERER